MTLATFLLTWPPFSKIWVQRRPFQAWPPFAKKRVQRPPFRLGHLLRKSYKGHLLELVAPCHRNRRLHFRHWCSVILIFKESSASKFVTLFGRNWTMPRSEEIMRKPHFWSSGFVWQKSRLSHACCLAVRFITKPIQPCFSLSSLWKRSREHFPWMLFYQEHRLTPKLEAFRHVVSFFHHDRTHL